MHPLVQIAKETVELYIRKKKIYEIREDALPEELRQRAGVFVCLKTSGLLRGCIGTFHPTEPNVAQETVRNAISAATCDPRFSCIRAEELDSLEYTVDVLTQPEPVADRSQLDPRRYGVIVQAGGRRGLLLPDLEGVDTVDEQIAIAMQKAGIAPGTEVTLYRFEVKRYH
ncbi:MAG: AMMECR1 domain-containing protein [Nitrospirae bacterium GWC2_57_9]|nr:MAG: AMMECR1 domain-containing protein [Nitrospirae bacterium GWC2_57_9]